MIRCSLPIKCLEAVVISMYFTAFIPHLTRFPVTFKSVSNGQAFYHIVLALQYKDRILNRFILSLIVLSLLNKLIIKIKLNFKFELSDQPFKNSSEKQL